MLLIKNGYIVDGTGKDGFRGDVLVKNSQIIKVAKKIDQDMDHILDVRGKVVSPGFIDTHSHSDLQILINPHIETKIRQGVTTEVLGQDGISMAPLPKKYIKDWRKYISGLDGDSNKINWGYKNVKGYLDLLEKKGVCQNVCYLLPHGNVRMEVMGLKAKIANRCEIEKMKDVVKREMEAGCVGLSSGLIYMPCVYSDTTELIELCKVVAKFNGVFVVHQRSEADDILTSINEVVDIGRKSNVKIHFSHFKICGKKNLDKIYEIINILENSKKEGIQISFDQYPYTAGSTMLDVVLPPWAHDGGVTNMLKRLKDKDLRKKMVCDIEMGIKGWDNLINLSGFDGIYITDVKTKKNQDIIGKNLIEIGNIKKKDPCEAVFDLLIEEKNAVSMVDFCGNEDVVSIFMKRPEQNVCSDGIFGGKPHPRVYGAFPRVLGKYVREDKVLALEEAIYKMTYKAAKVLGIYDRGIIKEGMKADIVIFDKDKIKDMGTYENPKQYPEGINYVIVNGKVVLANDVYNRKLEGAVLRV